MTTHGWLGFILTAGAVLEVPTGLALLLAPAVVVEILLRAPLDGTGLAIARLAGGGLLAVGIACWVRAGRRPPRLASASVAAFSPITWWRAHCCCARTRPCPAASRPSGPGFCTA
jgi:hypothetical protein